MEHERRFTPSDQQTFAELSGDYNPVHLDPVQARRTLFGRVLVHGIHAALWGLDTVLRHGDGGVSLKSVHASFPSPIGVGDPVRLSETSAGDEVEVALEVRGATAAWIRASWSPRHEPVGVRAPDGIPERREPRDTLPDELPERSGRLPLHLDGARSASLFPALSRRLDPVPFAQVLATTRLVGMECPGLRSVFSELRMDFSGRAAHGEGLLYRVNRWYPGLSFLAIDLQGSGMEGSLKAFVRPAPRQQPSMRALADSVRPGEFAGQRALIIGGSRGLGEVTAKLLAAGGASVLLTYRSGAVEAERIVHDIAASGGDVSCARWDVLAGGAAALPAGWSPTHLYYFATPHITPGMPGHFSVELLDAFRAYYVTGLLNSVAALAGRSTDLRAVFCPSSVYVEAPPKNLAEYAAAKTEGEAAAGRIATMHPGWIVESPRLPRLATDQTATLIRNPAEEPAPVLLRHLRAFHERAGAAPKAG